MSEASRRAAEEYMDRHVGEWFTRAQVFGMLMQHVDTAIARAVADRDIEWWEAIACVDNVPPTPEGCKWFVMNMQEHWIKEAVEGEREEIAWLENAVASGHFHHKKWEPRCYYCAAALRAPAPDKNCITTGDSGCAGKGCMHDAPGEKA